MRTPFVALIAAAVSAIPCFWMAILAVAQYGNLWMQPPYIREFPAIVAFWLGFISAVGFFCVCVRRGLRRALSPLLLIAVGIGIIGGIAEEIMLLNNSKLSFPVGFLEIAPLSWVIAGVFVSKLPGKSLRPPANI